MKLLIVEDEPLFAEFAAQLLEDAGLSACGIADNLQSALLYAKMSQPDVALVDLQLADGVNGLDVAKTLANDFGIRIVVMTGTPHVLLGRSVDWPVLTKPFTRDQLLQAVLS
jgi:CheY-like chemotaxis protein